MSTDKFLEALAIGEEEQATDIFANLMAEKIASAIEVAKVGIASDLFGESVEKVDEVNARHSFTSAQAALTPKSSDVKAAAGKTARDKATTNKYARRIAKLTGGEYSKQDVKDNLKGLANEEVEQVDEALGFIKPDGSTWKSMSDKEHAARAKLHAKEYSRHTKLADFHADRGNLSKENHHLEKAAQHSDQSDEHGNEIEHRKANREDKKKPIGGTKLNKEEVEQVDEKYLGFKKLKAKIAAKGGVRDAAAVAAAIGRKKYGKEKFQAMAAAGKKANEEVELDEASGRSIVDNLKSDGKHEEAGAAASKHGLGRKYGQHFGMRDTYDRSEAAFHRGYDRAEAKRKYKESEHVAEASDIDKLGKKYAKAEKDEAEKQDTYSKKYPGGNKQKEADKAAFMKRFAKEEVVSEVADADMQDTSKQLQAHRTNLQKMNMDPLEKTKVLAALKSHMAGKRLNLAQNTSLTGYLERAGGLSNVNASVRNKALKQQ